ADVVDQIIALADQRPYIVEQVTLRTQVPVSTLACPGLNTAHARSRRGFADKPKIADLSGSIHVGAATKLHRKVGIKRNNPDPITVFLAKKHDSATLPSFLYRNPAVFLQRNILLNLFIHQLFNSIQLVRSNLLKMGKV